MSVLSQAYVVKVSYVTEYARRFKASV